MDDIEIDEFILSYGLSKIFFQISNHNIISSFLGSLLESDIFRRLVGGTSFLLDLVRMVMGSCMCLGMGSVSFLSYISYSNILYISFDFYWEYTSLSLKIS